MLADVSKILAGYPVLEFTVAALIALVTVYGMVRAERKRNTLPAPEQMPPGVQMFFDGPLVVALKEMTRIRELLEKAEAREIERTGSESEARIRSREHSRANWSDANELGRDILASLRAIDEHLRHPK